MMWMLLTLLNDIVLMFQLSAVEFLAKMWTNTTCTGTGTSSTRTRVLEVPYEYGYSTVIQKYYIITCIYIYIYKPYWASFGNIVWFSLVFLTIQKVTKKHYNLNFYWLSTWLDVTKSPKIGMPPSNKSYEYGLPIFIFCSM
jgi:hypothetical protein